MAPRIFPRLGARRRPEPQLANSDSYLSSRQRTRTIEQFEQRMLLAISPTLVAIIPNDGAVLSSGQTRDTAPRELTIRFDAGQIIDPATAATGIQLVRSGNDGTFGNGNDTTIAPGYIGIGDNPNEIIVRFAETLPDDFYQLTVVGQGAGAIKNTEGDLFNNGTNVATPFRLDLGAQIKAVVPQPITRNAQGALQQANDQIVVYFNNDKLDPPSAQNVNLYQLIFTANTASNADDVVYKPTSASYDPGANAVTLTFAGNLSTLGSGAGSYRLRIGDDTVQASAPLAINVGSDAGSSLGTATNLGFLTSQSQILNGGTIFNGVSPTNTPYTLTLPGGNDNPGHRDIPAESHLNGGPDGSPNIAVQYYNFKSNYGADPQGNQLQNLITEEQKQRAREVFEIYGNYLGIQFIESPDQGFTIVTGDLRALSPTIPTGPGGVAGLAGGSLAIMDAAENWGASEFGGGWFTTAMHEIGHLLGYGHTYDLPPLTVMGSEGEVPVVPAEPVFPGDADIIHGQYMYRPDSKDVDFYRFQLTTSGKFSAETIAERLTTSSLLDTVISLYDATGKLLARNDDYFSSDSYLNLQLEPGVYYVGVSSTGNTNFNPLLVDTGFGGTTEGSYQLRLNFDPTPAGAVLVDATQTRFDGDHDGVPGGEFNFWFNVGTSTIYVDKTAPTTGANGTLARPYNTISTALAAATPGTVVRIVGNGGADGNVNTLGDNRAYEVGLNQFGTPLADGATMNVPQGVTVMIDAGAVFKLRQANINVGSFAQGIDMSRGALQVLGTPSRQVTFTSYNNEAIGVDTNPLATVPAPGDWGGLVFRGGTPDRASDREDQGIFVNYVGGANISYGGGTVVVDSQPGVYNPIHMATSRPTIAYNTIVNSASAAVSADPDSFAETLFRDDSSTAEYSRVGPEIHGNRLTSNSINALFVRIQTDAGVPLDVMRVQGRFNDTDIVHVISENLVINGTPGGPIDNGQGPQARLDARLAIDPGVVVKLKGSRIEVGVGAQLIAEGIASNRVIFTSLADDRFGAGGTFDTTGDGSQSRPAAGDWGGLYFHPVSTGSIDHSLITFAGGTTPIEGTFANFNAIEVRQAAVRIANSILEVNADGYSANDRNGRGANGPATIFVRGAQPIVVNNIIRDNAGDALSVNANALSARTQGDWGRSTGFLGAYAQFDDNFGPLVRLNRVVDNDVNGLTVRGATLTAESVWDDTDIVHVLREAIEVPNLHTYGGLRLQSSPTQSLVVKLSGPTAGFSAGGKPLDIDDRIGGSLLVLGTPGHPVVMTSLNDNSVGAGFNLEGQPQTQTLGGNVPTGNPVSKLNIDFRYSTEFAANAAALEALKLAASYWENVLDDPITLIFDISFAALDSGILGQASSVIDVKAYDEVRQRMIDDAVGGEEFVAQLPTLAQLQTSVGTSVTVSPNIALSRANALALGYTPAQLTTQLSTNDNVTPIDGTITFTNLATWDFNRLDGLSGADFVSTAIHEIGHALGFFSSVDAIDGGATTVALTTLDLFRVSPGAGAVDFTNAPRQITPGADAVFYDGGVFNRSDVITGAMTVGDIPLSNGKNLGDGFQASHWKNRGLLGISQAIGVMDPTVVAYGTITSADSRALGLMGWDVVRRGSPGDWAGIVISQYSNDRNVDITNELEPGYTGVNDVNSTPNTAQFLGTLAANEANGDENRRLGFEIHGSISFDRSTDLDVYSFNGTAGTEVWFDIDRTAVSLDTVLELVDANGNVLARSNDSTAESANPNLFTNNPAGNLARTLQRGEFSSYDLYTTNPRDAGMRVVLPGTVGTTNTYYVRVRSLGTNISSLTTGQTSGEYRLQIRLREIDEFPGSTVRFADIRYATTGIKVEGMPAHSPLLGDQTRVAPVNNVFSNVVVSNAQDLGNLLASDRNAISLASVMATPLDVQWYKFTVDYQDIQSIAGFSDGGKTWATVFDIDYADGVSRPNLTLSVFDELGNLVLVSRDSDVADDTPSQAGGSSATDLTRGSFGKLDPFIGSVQLAEGTSKTYYVAISSDIMLPSVLDGTFKNEATNKLIRLEPITSIRRIVDDHIGFTGTPTGAGAIVANPPPAILPIDDPVQLKTNVVQFTLADVGLFVSQSNTSPSRLVLVNPATGEVKSSIGSIAVQGQTNSFVGDLAIRSDGMMYATQSIPTAAPNNTAGRLVQIDPTNARAYIVGQDNIPTVPLNQGVPTPTSGDQVISDVVDALAYQRLPINENYTNAESDHYGLYYSVRDELTNTSRLFWANAATGEANSGSPGPYGPVGSGGAANPAVTDNGQIYAVNPGDIGIVTGMAFVQRQGLILDAVGPNAILDGQIFTISDSSRTVTFEFEKANNGIGANRTAVNIVGAVDVDDVVDAIRAAIVSAGLNITFIVNQSGFGELTLVGAFGASPGNSNLQFFGLPDDGFTLYGVDSRGQFFSLDTFGSFFGGGGPLAYNVFQLSPSAPFTGLAQGPVNLDLNGDGFGGDLVNTVFAICSNGDLYAIDTLTGTFRTDVFPNGADHISTFLQGATGLAFSPLDFNLWHPTTQQGSDPGHGINVAFDHTRDEMTPQQRVGGASFYFGFENSGGGYISYPQAGLYGIRQEATQFGVLSAAQQQDLTAYSPRGALGATLQTPIPLPLQANPELAANTIIGNNYNFPGGAHGALVTNAFSLDGYDYTDKPTLYFNYFMEGSASARVYISSNDGATWDLVASNVASEVPDFVSASSRTAGQDPIEQQVQPLFRTVKDAGGVLDNTWRQVRIDIGEYAGQSNLKLKFEVNTGTSSNNFKGLYIDDLIVGFASRGEMVTQSNPNTALPTDIPFFVTPQDPTPGGVTQVLSGLFQLEIRRGEEYAGTGDLLPVAAIYQQFDVNDRMVQGYTLVAPAGNQLSDGQTLTISDGVNSVVFEFNSVGGVSGSNVAIPFTAGSSAVTVASAIKAAVNSRFGSTFKVSAGIPAATSTRVDLAGAVRVTTTAGNLGFFKFDKLGDQNVPRDQGMILLQNNKILGSLAFGITVDAGQRDPGPHLGGVRNLINVNTPQLVPGVVIANNLLAFNQLGGIDFSGDSRNPGDSYSAVPFGRILNNTIYGSLTATGIGIKVGENAAPTILNNILANLELGIGIDPSSSPLTVIGGSLYQGNTANIAGAFPGSESFAIALNPLEPLFINPAAVNFNLAAGSRAIDSAINSLQDRQAMITVNAPIGIGQSPILAPLNDLTGKLRVDDPSVLPPAGLGLNVFKDRGAFDRSDFTGPQAVLANPQDNDTGGIDQDPGLNRVIPAGVVLRDFQIQLVDGTGTGIDPLSVASSKFILTRDGVTLVDGVDYVFGYDQTNQIVKFTPVAGIWLGGFTYVINLDNSSATGIKDLAANPLLPNELSGVTRFTIVLSPLDFGDAPDPLYPTLLTSGGARHVIVPGIYLGAGVSEDSDGKPSADASGDNSDDGVVFNTPLVPGVQSTVTITASATGFIDAFLDLNGDGDWDEAGEKFLNSVPVVAGANVLNFTLPAATATQTFARIRYSSTGGLGPTGIATSGEVEDYAVTIPASAAYTVQLFNPATGREVFKDAQGRYVVLANTQVEARVYVDDTRSTGAAGGVFAAFADLVSSLPLVQWDGSTFSVAPAFNTGVGGTVDPVFGVDEGGGIRGVTPAGADPKQQLFTVRGSILPAAIPGTTFSISVNAAEQLPAHRTLVYGLNGPVAATYGSVDVVVPLRAWQNPYQPLDVFPDGFISGLDALLIINEINKPGGSSTPLDPTPVPPNVPPPYLDVDGDGFVSATDAILVINELNNPTLGQPFIVLSQAVPEESAAVPAASAVPAESVVEDVPAVELAAAPVMVASAWSAPVPAAAPPALQLTDLALTVYDNLDESLLALHSSDVVRVSPVDALSEVVHEISATLPTRAAQRVERVAATVRERLSSADVALAEVAQLFAAHADDDSLLGWMRGANENRPAKRRRGIDG